MPGRSIPIAQVFNDGGCTGGNRSPALEWRGVPQGTKSFAITMFDLDDSGSPSGWWHRVVYDLPVPQNAGSHKNLHFRPGPYGSCPGNGEFVHRYLITIHALKVAKLPVPPQASGAMVSWTARDYVLAKATLTEPVSDKQYGSSNAGRR